MIWALAQAGNRAGKTRHHSEVMRLGAQTRLHTWTRLAPHDSKSTNTQKDRPTNRPTDRQTASQTYRQTNKQTNKHTNKSRQWGPGTRTAAPLMTTPGVELGLSQPQRDVLTTRRRGLLHEHKTNKQTPTHTRQTKRKCFAANM